MMTQSRVRGALAVGVVAALSLVGVGGSRAASPADAVFMPGVDLAVVANLQAMRQAPIYAKLDAMSKQNEQLAAGAPGMSDLTELRDKLTRITGLREEDLLGIRLAVDLDGIDFKQPEQTPFESLNLVMASQLAKPLPLAKLEEAIRACPPENEGGAKVEIARLAHGKRQLLAVKNLSEENQVICLTMAGEDRVLLAGTEKGVKGAGDRVDGGGAAGLAQEFGAAIGRPVAGSQMFLLFEPTAAMMEQLKAEIQADPAAANGNPMAAAFARIMQGLTGVSLGVNLADAMNVRTVVGVGSEADAQQAKTLMDSTVISMLNFSLAMLTGGQPMALAQSLKTSVGPASTVVLEFAVNAQDLDILGKALEKQAAAAAQMAAEAAEAATAVEEDAEAPAPVAE